MTRLDEQLQLWVVEHRVGVLDPLFVGLSLLGSLGLVWIAIAVGVAASWRRARIVVLVAGAVLVSDLVSLALKAAIGRPRPYVRFPEQEPLLHAALDLSLPSGHAATSFAGATVLARALPRLAPALLALAAVIAASRVYVGVHYPADVVAGALLGVAVGLALAAAARAHLAPRALRPLPVDPPRSPPEPPPG